MVDRDVLFRRLAKLEDLLRRLRAIAQVEREVYLHDDDLQAKAERWLHLAAECCMDLAQHLIADRGWRTPASNREAFQILGREGVLSDELTAQMEGWAGFRNVLVHLYLEVDQEQVFVALTDELDQLGAFADAVIRCVEDEDRG